MWIQKKVLKQIKLTKNDSFFENVNLRSAYWAGFIAADGCVFPPENKISLELGIKDADHLKLFLEDLNWSGQIRYRDRGHISLCRAQISGAKKIIQDLQNIYHITQAKSKTLQPPNINGETALAFLIGVIDGDGNIGKSAGKYKYTRLTITTGSKDFSEWIYRTLDPLSGDSKTGVRRIYCQDSTFNVIYTGKCADSIIASLLEVDVPKLSRKWADFSPSEFRGKRNFSGSLNPNSKLTEAEIDQIPFLYSSGVTQTEIALALKVSQTTISRHLRKHEKRIKEKEDYVDAEESA